MITCSAPTTRRLRMPWRNGIAVGRAFDLVRTDLLEHLAFLQRTIGYRYCRFHAIFDDDMQVVQATADGGVAYQWRQVDLVYDRLLALGLKPFVELNPMPTALASGSQQMFWFKMNVTPPKAWQAWEDLVEAFARHLVERYGMDEVRSWYFEVWNEPNLGGFWSGSKEQYFQLYDASARALKRVDAGLRVGGPASSKASWLEDLIDHCAAARVPLDFLSTHLYPQDEYVDYQDRQGSPHAPGAYFTDTVRDARARIERRLRERGLPAAELHWTEWNSMACARSADIDWVSNPTNDALHGAAFVARTCLALDQTIDTLCWWTASDVFFESGLSLSAFQMGYGLLTIHGIPKSSYQAFALLRRLGGQVVPVELGAGAPAGAGAAATREGDATDLLLWNQRLLEDATPAAWRERVRLPTAGGAAQVVLSARIRAGAGSAYESWLALGAPHNLAPVEEAALRAQAEPQWTVAAVSAIAGMVELEVVLEPGEVLYLQIRPQGARARPRTTDAKALATWNAAMGERSR